MDEYKEIGQVGSDYWFVMVLDDDGWWHYATGQIRLDDDWFVRIVPMIDPATLTEQGYTYEVTVNHTHQVTVSYSPNDDYISTLQDAR